LIGGLCLFEEVYPELRWRHYMLPLILIGIGLLFILRRRERVYSSGSQDRSSVSSPGIQSDENEIDSTAFFGGVKKNITSTDFRGGEATAVFGGIEINLMQADIHGKVVLEITAVCGGVKLIVPPAWQIKSEVVAVLGGIGDKRKPQPTPDTGKILILKGNAILGGIEIDSH